MVRFRHAEGGESQLTLPPGGLVVGRVGGGADLELAADTHMSRRHGRFWRQGEEVWFEDLGSSNGSFYDGQRVESPVLLQPGVPLRLGKTSLSLCPEQPQAPRPQRMTLKLEQTPGLLSDEDQAGIHIAALYDFVQGLLGSTSKELISLTLKRLNEVVPAAQRISLVAWPPQEEDVLGPLLDEPEFSHDGPVSYNMACYAIQQRKALLLSDAEADPKVEISAALHGILSAVYVPLLTAQDEPFGLLCVDTPTPSVPFTPEDFRLIQAAGSLLGTALAAERLREEARQRERDLEKQQAWKSAMVAFLKIASHDLKNPLTAIHLGAQLLKVGQPPDFLQQVADGISDSVKRAEGLIRNYLQVAELQDGHELVIDWQKIDLVQMAEEEVAFIQRASRLDPDKTRFELELGAKTIWADPQKFRQVLTNLLSNAVKYSPQGGEIRLASRVVGEEVEVSIADQGVGIAEADQGRLFQSFERMGDKDLAEGTGLGLWLSQALVEAHGGKIQVESELGEGTTFRLTLPQ